MLTHSRIRASVKGGMSALPSTAIAMQDLDHPVRREQRGRFQPSPHRQVRSALMITVSGLTRQYGKRLAVDDMTFDVAGSRHRIRRPERRREVDHHADDGRARPS